MSSDSTKQEHPIVAVDSVIFTIIEGKLNVLLIKIKYGPFKGEWGIPGGKVRVDETLDEAARRELYEKTGVKNVYLEQLYSFGETKRDPRARIISVAYFALVDSNKVKLDPTTKYHDIKWAPVEKMGNLAYDHNKIIDYATMRLHYKIQTSNIIWGLMPEKFTLAELQNVYEIIIGKKLDKRNFRKKIRSFNLIKSVGRKVGVPFRPPLLYSFKKREFKRLNVF